MTIRYLKSTAVGLADGTTWDDAYTTLAAAYAGSVAGDIIYVSNNHAQTQATAMTLTSPGTVDNPCYVICVDDSAEPPTALATTATIENTGNVTLNIFGSAFYYGIAFRQGVGGVTTGVQHLNIGGSVSSMYAFYHTCSFHLGRNDDNDRLVTYAGNDLAITQSVTFKNCSVSFSNTGQSISCGNLNKWVGGSVTGATIPTFLFTPTENTSQNCEIIGVDLSLMGSGKALYNGAGTGGARVVFRNCKLGASVAISTGTFTAKGHCVEVINCDSSDTNYTYESHDYTGVISNETAIVRTGGASHPDSIGGTVVHSRKMVSSTRPEKGMCLEYGDLIVQNANTGSAITLTVHIVTDNVTLTDQEIWLEVEYLGTSGTPYALFADNADTLAHRLLAGAASNQPTSTETWTTTGLGTPVKQQLAVSVTPEEKGPIRCRVFLAKPSTTVYVCPKVEISTQTSASQYQIGAQLYLLEPASSGGTNTLFNIIGTS